RHTRSDRDWSSDVSSSDLEEGIRQVGQGDQGAGHARRIDERFPEIKTAPRGSPFSSPLPRFLQTGRQVRAAFDGRRAGETEGGRSEERRVGKEGRGGRGRG